ncbi:MAG: BA14K family protein [Phyllobacterium sp.]
MKRILSAICVSALSLAVGFTSVIPVSAAPLVPRQIEVKSNVEQIQHRRDRRIGVDRHDRRGHWKGYRGYRHGRHGYRRHNDGWWYPLAAFGAGAIIGGAIANQPSRAAPARGNSHVQWCYDKYRSYRASDNTYQPYNGPRQQCYSPYR